MTLVGNGKKTSNFAHHATLVHKRYAVKYQILHQNYIKVWKWLRRNKKQWQTIQRSNFKATFISIIQSKNRFNIRIFNYSIHWQFDYLNIFIIYSCCYFSRRCSTKKERKNLITEQKSNDNCNVSSSDVYVFYNIWNWLKIIKSNLYGWWSYTHINTFK